MALPMMNFPILTPEQANPWMTGLSRGFALGDQIRQAMYAPQMNQAELQLKQAQAKRELARANLPFGGESLPGVAGQIVGLEAVRKMYGDNSPQYQQAQKAFQLDQQSDLSRILYQNKLASTLPYRNLTPTGRGQVEEARVAAGLTPGGTTWDQAITPLNMDSAIQPGAPYQNNRQLPLSQEQISALQQKDQQLGFDVPNQPVQQQYQAQAQQIPQGQQSAAQQTQAQPAVNYEPKKSTNAPGTPEQLREQYELKRLRENIPQPVLMKNLSARNIEVTLNAIDPDAITSYGGLKGAKDLKVDEFKASLGMPTKRYQKYMEAVNLAHFAADQITQFYGSSIQPEQLKEKLARFNTANWKTDPETAKMIFNSSKNLTDQELQTYRLAGQSTAAYKGKWVLPEGAENMPLPKIRVITPEGQAGTMSVADWNNLDEATRKRFKRD